MIRGIAVICYMWGLQLPLMAAEPPSGEYIHQDVESLFFQNAHSCSALKVRWTWSGGPTSEHSKTLRWLVEKAKGNASVPKENIAQLETIVAQSPESQCTAIRQEFLTDRENFQLRSILDERGSSERVGRLPSVGDFPEVELTARTLVSEFAHIAITSFGPQTDGLFRRWDGQQPKPGIHSGIVASKNVEYATIFPPLALPPETWGGKVSWIDQAFGTGAVSSRIVGDEVIDGAGTVVLERILPIGNTTRQRVYLAYCDLSRGAIPMRIEVYEAEAAEIANKQIWSRLNWDGVLRENEIAFPQYVIDSIKLKDCDGVWYPMSGRVRQFTPSGPDRTHPLVAGQEWNWDCSLVDTQFKPTPGLFALTFPKGTIFVDHTKNETRLVGDVDGYADTIIGGIRPESRGPSRLSLWWWASIAIVFLGIVTLWRRLRSQS